MKKTQAAIMFNIPGISKTSITENPGKVDEKLRNAILEAKKVFWKLFWEDDNGRSN